jgi:hypothetical protein
MEETQAPAHKKETVEQLNSLQAENARLNATVQALQAENERLHAALDRREDAAAGPTRSAPIHKDEVASGTCSLSRRLEEARDTLAGALQVWPRAPSRARMRLLWSGT